MPWSLGQRTVKPSESGTLLDGSIAVFFYKDLKIYYKLDLENNIVIEETFESLEEAQGERGHSLTWVLLDAYAYQSGLFPDDYTESPNSSIYGFIFLLILGGAIIIFGILDRKYDFSVINFSVIRFILYILVLIPCTYIIVECIKFPGSYIIGPHYSDVARTVLNLLASGEEWVIFYPTPYVIIFSLLFVMMIVLTALDVDIKRIKNEIEKTNKINS